MNELIEHIRTAVAQGATAEQKVIGVQACRTILTALAAEPGKPIVFPGASAPNPLSKLSLDQVLDLLIARLSIVATSREPTSTPLTPVAQRGLRVPTAQPPPVPSAGAQSRRAKVPPGTNKP